MRIKYTKQGNIAQSSLEKIAKIYKKAWIKNTWKVVHRTKLPQIEGIAPSPDLLLLQCGKCYCVVEDDEVVFLGRNRVGMYDNYIDEHYQNDFTISYDEAIDTIERTKAGLEIERMKPAPDLTWEDDKLVSWLRENENCRFSYCVWEELNRRGVKVDYANKEDYKDFAGLLKRPDIKDNIAGNVLE